MPLRPATKEIQMKPRSADTHGVRFDFPPHIWYLFYVWPWETSSFDPNIRSIYTTNIYINLWNCWLFIIYDWYLYLRWYEHL